MGVLGVIIFCSGSIFFLKPLDDLADRLQIVLTCLLTIVAFKFMVQNKVPAVPYATMLDIYFRFGYFLCALNVWLSLFIRGWHSDTEES